MSDIRPHTISILGIICIDFKFYFMILFDFPLLPIIYFLFFLLISLFCFLFILIFHSNYFIYFIYFYYFYYFTSFIYLIYHSYLFHFFYLFYIFYIFLSFSPDGDRIYSSDLICSFIDSFDCGKDLEKQLDLYCECRSRFRNLEIVKVSEKKKQFLHLLLSNYLSK